MHNSEFLVAHFHNMLIPGSLFGYLAGYMYWFPKAFGFRLDERWGKRAFWSWLIGFQLAFLPLYVLGLMGMPRRMEHYANPQWQPWLIVAAAGAVLILVGIVCLVVQLIVSIRDRERLADLSGDPWDGRTLEWATSSPPPAYNFAVIPEVCDIDAFMEMKQRAEPLTQDVRYEAIPLPQNTATGFLIGGLAFLLGFALIWHIWVLAVAAGIAIFSAVTARGFVDDADMLIPASEVELNELNRRTGADIPVMERI
jgi:cytochrome o ubiquinol oxidase subunit I